MQFSLLATQLAAAALVTGSIAGAAALPQLSAEQILERIAAAEAARDREVSGFSAVRHYELSNNRGDKTATVDARMVYHLDSAKSFEVIREGGNDSLFRRVIHRVLDGEAEASRNAREDSRLTERNYAVRVIGTETAADRPCYVVELTPRRHSKYLIAGKAWIDAGEFAIVRIEGRPSASLSFWVGKPYIVQTFLKVGNTWALYRNRSVADVRFLGRTELTIQASDFVTPVRSAELQPLQ